jgi:hypothetical protein
MQRFKTQNSKLKTHKLNLLPKMQNQQDNKIVISRNTIIRVTPATDMNALRALGPVIECEQVYASPGFFGNGDTVDLEAEFNRENGNADED